MPLYEYQCKSCGRTVEKRQKFSDAPLTICPYCSGPLEQLISAPAVQFKGGGWYADGYGSKSSAKSGASASASGESGSSSGDSNASAKSESKASDSSSASSASSSASTTPAAKS